MSKPIEQSLELLAKEVEVARERIAPVVRKTPLLFSQFYSELTGANVYLKCENLQTTGSFKLRGATNKFLSTSDDQRQHIVAASTGNHGKAVAFVAKKFGAKCTIFAPDNAQPIKLDAMRRMDADVQIAGSDCVEAELVARQFADKNGIPFFSPYNDSAVVAGQGTIGLELSEQLDSIDAVFASVGGGGMLSGLAAAVARTSPDCQFVACSPQNSCVMIQSLEAGELLDLPSLETLSDGTAGGVEEGSITFGLCRQLVTESVRVSEAEIAQQLRQFVNVHSQLIEGAAAAALAGLLKNSSEVEGKNVVVVLCGANISFELLATCALQVKDSRARE